MTDDRKPLVSPEADRPDGRDVPPGIYLVNATGDMTALATEDGHGDRRLLQETLQEHDVNGRFDGPRIASAPLAQLKVSLGGCTVTTGPLKKRPATKLHNALLSCDGLSVERIGYWSDDGDGRGNC